MKDGQRIADQSRFIQAVEPRISIAVATSAPVCSKTRAYLNKKGVALLDLDELNRPA